MFDFIGNVRNHLNGATQIITATFIANHLFIHLTGGEAVSLGEVTLYKALVMPQIQVGFRAIVGNEHFAMLERTHGAWIDVDIRIHL